MNKRNSESSAKPSLNKCEESNLSKSATWTLVKNAESKTQKILAFLRASDTLRVLREFGMLTNFYQQHTFTSLLNSLKVNTDPDNSETL